MKPYYEEAGITIYHGDSFQVLPTFDPLPGIIVTDVPYGVGKDYGLRSKDDIAGFQRAIRLIADSLAPACSTFAVCRIWDVPVRPQWTGVWAKTYGASALLAYPVYPHWEPIGFWNIKGNYRGNCGHRSDVFVFPPERAQDSDHPAPKPLSLMAELIEFMGGSVAFDPFMGSGTTLVAAKRLGLTAIGIEIEERYCEIAVRRLAQSVMQFPAPEPAAGSAEEVNRFTEQATRDAASPVPCQGMRSQAQST